MSVEIRAARPGEAGRVLDHARAIHRRDRYAGLHAPEEFDLTVERVRVELQHFAERGRGRFLLALADGEVVGTLRMAAGDSRRTAHVADLGLSVSSAWRRRGVAGELLDAALAAAEAGTIRRIAVAVIAANEPALRLFASRGFEEEGRRPGHVRIDGEAHDLVLLGRDVTRK